VNHLLCSRCGAAVEHLNALLGHYQEVHGGVPKPRFFCPDGCNTSAMESAEDGPLAQEELFTCVSECYNVGATQVPQLRLANSPLTVRFARLSRDLCRSETQRKGGLFCGR
jgi:hypothetical protein